MGQGRTPGPAASASLIKQVEGLLATAFCWRGIAEQPGREWRVAVGQEGSAALLGQGELSGVHTGLQGLLLAKERPLNRIELVRLLLAFTAA